MKGIRGPKGIFVSYRHGDVDDIAGRIADAMRNRFGEKRVFFDDAIPVGAEWKDYIDRNLGSCRAALIVIGPKWISATDEEGEVKSEREKDYVAYEVQSVLAREPKIRCFPVLVGGAQAIPVADLPESIWDLPQRQWCEIREGQFFKRDIDFLIDQIDPSPARGRLMIFAAVLTLLLAVALLAHFVFRAPEVTPDPPTPFANLHINSIGMQFVPADGTKVLFAKYETTVEEYGLFAAETNRKIFPPKFGKDPKTGEVFRQSINHPAVMVSWEDASAFCQWLTEQEHRTGWLKGTQSYRLPTDAEWSVAIGLESGGGAEAAGAGKEIFHWGDDVWPPPNHVGNYGGGESVSPDSPKSIEGFSDNHPFTSPVGAYPATRMAISDLGGNVWEWCDDADGEMRILRGGSWNNVSRERLTSDFRNMDAEGAREDNVGFRCVIDFGSD